MTAPFAARARRRVLVVAPFVPSVDGAHGSSRAIGSLVAALADHHDVGVIYLRGLDEARIDPALEGRLAFTAEVPRPGPAPAGRRRVRLLASLARGRPMWVHHFWSHALDEAIKRAVRSFQPDVVQVELAVLAPALAAVPRRAAPLVLVDYDPAVPSALDRFRAQPRGPLRWLHAIDVVAWWWTERCALRRADAAVVFTERDRQRLARLAGHTPIHVIPLAVEPSAHALDPVGDAGSVLFVGSAEHQPNVEAVRRLATQIIPRVAQRVPGVRLHIVGDHPRGSVHGPMADHLVLEGRVADVTPLLDRAAVVVAPLRLGGGMRLKVVEALAAGKALVASPVAVAGLDVAAAGAALVEDSDVAFSDAVVRLLQDEGERRALAERARTWATTHLDRRDQVTSYEAVWGVARDRAAMRPRNSRHLCSPGGTPPSGEELIRRLGWRFLLPLPPSGTFDRLVIIGASPALAATAIEIRMAHAVSTTLDPSEPADVIAILADEDARPADAVASLRPGGILYWELDRRRRDRRRHTPGRAAAELRAAGTEPLAAYAIQPEPRRNDVYLPVDSGTAFGWYATSIYIAGSPFQRLGEMFVRGVTRGKGRRLGHLTPFHAAIAVVPEPREDHSTVVDRAATLNVAPSPVQSPVLINRSVNRAVLLTFASGVGDGHATPPATVIKVPTLPCFEARTRREQRAAVEIRAALPAIESEAIPEPLGMLDLGPAVVAAAERAVPGRSLARSCARPGRSLRAKVDDLRLAADWITRLHSAHALTDRVWDEQLCVAEVDAVLERFQRTLGRTAGEDQLFAATRRRARDLGGSALPLVWQHGDFTAWNTLRDGASLRVLDWEGAKPGLPLCDLLRFVTHWHEIVRSPRSTDQRLAMFRQLFGGEASPSRATAHARQALDRYVNALGLAPGCGPVLLVTSWSALALQRHEQRRDAGASLTDSRAYNEWIDYLGVLTPSGLL